MQKHLEDFVYEVESAGRIEDVIVLRQAWLRA
jgi:hypothetical protein